MRAFAMLALLLLLAGCGDEAMIDETADGSAEQDEAASDEGKAAEERERPTSDPDLAAGDPAERAGDEAADQDDRGTHGGDDEAVEEESEGDRMDGDQEGREPEQVYPRDRGERGDREEREKRRAPEGQGPGQVTGTLGGSAQLEGGCVWIDTGSGRYEVAWPAGYSAETNPVRLLRDGEVVAQAGDRLSLSGAVDAEAMTVCQVGPLFKATAVETPD